MSAACPWRPPGGAGQPPGLRADISIAERRPATRQPIQRLVNPVIGGEHLGGAEELVRRGQIMRDHPDHLVGTA